MCFMNKHELEQTITKKWQVPHWIKRSRKTEMLFSCKTYSNDGTCEQLLLGNAPLVSQIISCRPHTTKVPGMAPISMPSWIGCLLFILLIFLRGFTWSALHVLVDCFLHRNRYSWEQRWEPFQLGQEGAEHLSNCHYTPSSSLHV